MEIISLDIEEDCKIKENFLLGKYLSFFENKDMYDLQNNILIEVEIIHNDLSSTKENYCISENYIQNYNDQNSNTTRIHEGSQEKTYEKEINCDNSFTFNLLRDQSEYSNDVNDKRKYFLETKRQCAKIYFPKSKIKGTFIEEELKSTSENYLKIELKAKKNKINLDNLLECFDYLNGGDVEFHYNKENLISYFYAFSICKIIDKRREVLEKLLIDLSEENIIYFIKVCSNLNDEFLNNYSLWLIRFLINKQENLPEIYFNGYNYNTIVKFEQHGIFRFEEKSIILTTEYNDKRRNITLATSIKFLEKAYKNYLSEMNKYFEINNCFNVGKIIRRKSDSLIDDYPHYFQMVIENEPNLFMFAMRMSENSNFIISRSIDDFNKYGCNYIAEVSNNFWGTNFEIYDFGYDKSVYEKSPKLISHERKKIADVKYETNIMGECPRFFEIDLYYDNEHHRLSNLKPEWNEEMDCYCLNFYGRVKKASAKNFQIVYPDDHDNILLQHGKVSRDEFNIDFREPFNFVTAFAISLISIGKKRVVS